MNKKIKTSLILTVLILVSISATYATLRYMITKPASVNITTQSNKFKIDLYDAETGGAVIDTVAFNFNWIEDDPSQESTTAKTPEYWLRADNLDPATTVWVYFNCTGLSGITPYMKYWDGASFKTRYENIPITLTDTTPATRIYFELTPITDTDNNLTFNINLFAEDTAPST